MQSRWSQNDWLGGFVSSTGERVGDPDLPGLLGVGSLPLDGFPNPLILADAAVLGIYPEEAARHGDAMPPNAFAWDSLGAPERERLGVYEAPPRTIVIAVERPEPLGLIGSHRGAWTQAIPITSRVTNVRGTLGPKLSRRAASFLTAGHVVGPPGSRVERIDVRRFRPTRNTPWGTVLHRWDPVGGPAGYDVAVVSKDKGSATPVPELPTASLDQYSHWPHPAILLGAMSGRGEGLLEGALRIHTDGTRRWKNCWIMGPGHLGMEGDSGGAVITPEGEGAGILVGGSRVRGGRAFAFLYVQDLESIEVEALSEV